MVPFGGQDWRSDWSEYLLRGSKFYWQELHTYALLMTISKLYPLFLASQMTVIRADRKP
jgi:hypothetical protein